MRIGLRNSIGEIENAKRDGEIFKTKANKSTESDKNIIFSKVINEEFSFCHSERM
jgi:hypothetical protein